MASPRRTPSPSLIDIGEPFIMNPISPWVSSPHRTFDDDHRPSKSSERIECRPESLLVTEFVLEAQYAGLAYLAGLELLSYFVPIPSFELQLMSGLGAGFAIPRRRIVVLSSGRLSSPRDRS
jgi:hypothetical protein